MNIEQIRFIDRLYKDLYLDESVIRLGTGNKYDKFNNIKTYMEKLDYIHRRINETGRHKELLRELYYNKYVIKPEDIPDSYYRHQQEIALERGYGHIAITDDVKRQYQEQIIAEQKASLDIWLSYFISDDANVYPFWAIYWAFQGMLKLGSFDKETGEFGRRTKDTVAPFIDLNREALAMAIDFVIKSLNNETIDDIKLNELVKRGSFGKIYAYIINYVLKDKKNTTKKNDGRWIKFIQGTDHTPLVNSLQGHNTGWCTAGESTAKAQLALGDFYVYYTLDENNEYKVPRIAIRMEYGEIAEIRGIAKNQNLEPEMEDVLEEKLKEFPDRDDYLEKVDDMRELTKIYEKHKRKEELTKEELIFLYEIKDNIIGFGYGDDPRIMEIIKERKSLGKDLELIFNFQGDEEITSDSQADDDTMFLYRDLIADELTSLEDTTLPQYIKGSLSMRCVRSISNVKMPKIITEDLALSCLIDGNGVTLPKCVGRDLYLSDLTNAEGLVLPKTIGGFLYLSSLKNAKGLILSESLNCCVYLKRLENAEGLVVPPNIRDLYLYGLKNAKGLILPEVFNGSIFLSELTTTDGLVLPKIMTGCLDLESLSSAQGLILPERVDSLILNSLTNIDGLVLPKQIDDFLALRSLESIDFSMIPDPLTYEIRLKDFTITPENVHEFRDNKKK